MSGKTFETNGACLCGKVTYTATLNENAGACHCGMCRRWSSGPYMAVHAVGRVSFEGQQHINEYSSSQWAARGFCANCGSNLYYHLLPRPGLPDGEYILSAGTVADQHRLTFDNEVYIEEAPGWYQFSEENSRTRMTEAEIMATYGE